MFLAYKNKTFYLLVLKIFKFNKKTQNIPRHNTVLSKSNASDNQQISRYIGDI